MKKLFIRLAFAALALMPFAAAGQVPTKHVVTDDNPVIVRGVPVAGVWQRQGTIMRGNASESYVAQEPSLLYDTTSSIFNMWFTCGWATNPVPGICHATSPDAINWTRANNGSNPSVPHMFHSFALQNAGTYYIYGVDPTATAAGFNRYHSSDGVTWTEDATGILPATGVSGAWNSVMNGNTAVWVEGSNWYMLYEMYSGTFWQVGLATSSDGLSWTPYASNPVIRLGGGGCGGPDVHKLNGVYYAWVHCAPSYILPTQIYRYSSTDLHYWSLAPGNSGGAVLSRFTSDEGANNPLGQAADPSLVEVNGNTYMAYSATVDQTPVPGKAMHINLAIAPMTIAQLVLGNEGDAAIKGVVSDRGAQPFGNLGPLWSPDGNDTPYTAGTGRFDVGNLSFVGSTGRDTMTFNAYNVPGGTQKAVSAGWGGDWYLDMGTGVWHLRTSAGSVAAGATQTIHDVLTVDSAGNLACAGGACAGDGGAAASVIDVPVQTMCPGATQTNGNTGSGGTDIGPCVSSYLNAHATATQPINVVLDGFYKASGIFGPAAGNWGITGRGGSLDSAGVAHGTGLFQIAGSNNDVIHNGPAGAACTISGSNHWMDSGWINPGTPPARGSNLWFRDFVINGNRGNGTNGNSSSGVPQGYANFAGLYSPAYCWFVGINVMNINNVDVRGVYFYNTSAYNLRLDNTGFAHISGSTFANVGPNKAATYAGQNGDGVHIDGNSNDIAITGNTFNTSDDAIAVNAPEGTVGPITNVTATGNTFIDGASMMRMYTGSIAPPAGDNLPTVKGVTFSGNAGHTLFGFILGLGSVRTLTATNTISDVIISGNDVSAQAFMLTDDNIGSLKIADNTWRDGTCAYAPTAKCGLVNAFYSNQSTAELEVKNNTIVRGPSGNAADSVLDILDGGFGSQPAPTVTYGKVDISGTRVADIGGTYPVVPDLIAWNTTSTIADLTTSNNDRTSIGGIFPDSQASQITKMQVPTDDGFDTPGTGNNVVHVFTSANTQNTAWDIINRSNGAHWSFFLGGLASSSTANAPVCGYDFYGGGTVPFCWQSDGYQMGSGHVFRWSSSAGAGGVGDTGLSRSGADAVACGNGTTGDATCAFHLGSLYVGSTLTYPQVHGVIGLTSANSDTATMPGVTVGSYCTFSPANAAGAAALSHTYYTAGSGSVTFTHPGGGDNGAILAVLCTLN